MKNKISKIILVFALVLICTLLFNIKVYASSDFTYELDANNYASITAYSGSDSDLTIPSTIDGYEVKTIAEHAFDETRNATNGQVLVNLTISEGITTVEDFAFVSCSNLESITLPETLTDLGDFTFTGCSSLAQINIPSSLYSIGIYTFQETNFSEIIIPEHFQSIGSSSFRLCHQLKSVKVYSKTVNIASDAFQHCSSDLTFYGYEGSTVQTFATQNGFEFKLLTAGNEDDETIPAQSITLDKTTATLEVGDTITLNATILPENASDKNVVWTSSNSDIATVENGIVTAKSAGSVSIYATTTDGNKKATCNITVTEKTITDKIPVQSITLNKTTLSLEVGDTQTLEVSILPDNASDKTIEWSSSNNEVATVEDGTVTAKSAGSAIISVSTADGLKTASCKVTVTEKDNDNENEIDPTNNTIFNETKPTNNTILNSTNSIDNTISNERLPDTGISRVLFILIALITIIALVIYRKYNNLNQI